jgi:hypothetical protein
MLTTLASQYRKTAATALKMLYLNIAAMSAHTLCAGRDYLPKEDAQVPPTISVIDVVTCQNRLITERDEVHTQVTDAGPFNSRLSTIPGKKSIPSWRPDSAYNLQRLFHTA